jgi:hypothetical protein
LLEQVPLPADVQRPAFVVAGVGLNADDSELIELF